MIGSASAAWTEQWHFDVASFDYTQFLPHYETWGRIHYRTEIMAICANTIDNGVGSANKPILEVYIAGGMIHGEENHVDGSLYCINGATGEVIWHVLDDDIYVQSKMELADVNDDGELELYITDYTGSQLYNAQTGEEIWERSWTNYGETPDINNKRLDKQTVIIRDPEDGVVYLYQRAMYGYMYKRIAATGQLVATSSFTGYPCFGGCAAADMNGDGIPEIVEDSWGTYCLDLDMNKIWQDGTVVGGNTGAVPVLVDCNNDGWLDVVVMSASSQSCSIGVIDGQTSWNNRFGVGNGNAVWLKPMTATGHSGHNAPAVYDIDGDGYLEAGFGWVNDYSSPGCIWDLGSMQEETWSPDLDDGYSCTFANAWEDTTYLEILTGNLCHVWDHTGALVSSEDRYGSSPILLADVDGDGINEAISDGSNIFPVVSDPFDNGGTVWSWGWNICWDTGVQALNTRQEVLSQLFNTRRTGSELPQCPYLWTDNSTPPPTPTITIISPNGYETWLIGSQYTITWTSNNVIGNVSLDLYKGTTITQVIETSTINDGNTSWVIPSTITPGTDYRVKIKNSNGIIFDFSDNYFNIIEVNHAPNPPEKPKGPKLRLVDQQGMYWANGIDRDGDKIQYRFDWNASGSHQYSTWTSLVNSGKSLSKNHSWAVAGTYVVKVQSRDEHGAVSTWSNGLTVTVSKWISSYKEQHGFLD